MKSVAEAKAYLETPEGRAYDQAISTYFEQNNGPLLMDCFQIVKDPDASPFELVFTLSKDGKVLGVSVWPDTNISRCFGAKLNSKKFPVPPTDGYLAYMEMQFAP